VLGHLCVLANFRPETAYYPILRAVLDGQFTLAVSTSVLLEYEEIIVKMAGAQRWQEITALLDVLSRLHGNVLNVEAHFRFGVIAADVDDNKFCDCAIATNADFLVTEDHHFNVLKSAGYKTQPVTPTNFIRQHLGQK
jgi:uncharacterized protein